MKNLHRRAFIQKSAKGVAGAVALSSGLANLSFVPQGNAKIDAVDLGKTGMKIPRLALGTGSFGWK
ncbi:MAG TPA: hypothetical protein VKA38_08860, partial [Draconibacterium sp.]|nr:hypothetical protein [Draconibacterium sp.]